MSDKLEALDFVEALPYVPGGSEQVSSSQFTLKPRTVSQSAGRRPSIASFTQAIRATGTDLPLNTDIELAAVAPKDSDIACSTPVREEISFIRRPTTRQTYLYLLLCCWSVVVMGWQDGSTGPLVIRMEASWKVGFAIVSLLFVCSFFGFVLAGLLNVYLADKYGFGKVVVLGASCQCIAACLEASAPYFPTFALAFGINGFGCALLNAHVNVLIASMPDAAPKLGILHMTYGLGAFVSPFAATYFAQAPHWSYGYTVSVVLSFLGVLAYIFVFRFRTQEELLGPGLESTSSTQVSTGNKYGQIFRLASVHVLSFFVLVYVGLEVTMGGWIVTYLVQVRGGGPSSGYVSSGFFGGLALGRVMLLWVNKKLGTSRVIYLYSFMVIGLEMLIWFVPSVTADAVAASLVGLLLGPFYPLIVGTSRQILPHGLLAGAIGWIASFGQAGSALFPFLTGTLAQKYGIKVLQPMLVAMMAVDLSLWSLLPFTTRLMT